MLSVFKYGCFSAGVITRLFELNICICWPISSDTVTEYIVCYYSSLSVFILTLRSGRDPTDFDLNAAAVNVLYPNIQSNFITKLVKSRPNHCMIQNIKIIYLKTHNLFIPVPLKEKKSHRGFQRLVFV